VQLSSTDHFKATIDASSQEPAEPGHLAGPRHAKGLAAKWKALLFMAWVLFLFPLSLVPANWLTAHGQLQGLAAHAAAMHWGVFLAVLVPTTVAAWCEGQPVGRFGLAWRTGRGRLLAEGVVWGVGGAALLAGLLHATGIARGHGSTLRAGEAIRSGATWGLAVLGYALFEQLLKRGYLQSILGRVLGFWQAAWLLSVLFTLEKLLAFRNPLELINFLVIALLACLTLQRTGDLWFAVGLQTGLEWSMVFLFGMGLNYSTLHPPGTLMRVDMQGPFWLSGGEHGFSASAFFLALLVILAWRVQRRFPSPKST
jgi:membrane protease YdiL (CAAX protease family)